MAKKTYAALEDDPLTEAVPQEAEQLIYPSAPPRWKHTICENEVASQPMNGYQVCPFCHKCPPAAEFVEVSND